MIGILTFWKVPGSKQAHSNFSMPSVCLPCGTMIPGIKMAVNWGEEGQTTLQ